MVDNSLRERFPGHYRPTEDEFKELWADGLFVFDANVLLNAYRYSTSTREQLFSVLSGLGDRLWIPHQAAQEFQENRLGVIQRQREVFEQFKSELDSARSKLVAQARSLRRHPVLDAGVLEEYVGEGFTGLDDYLASKRKDAPELFNEGGGLILEDTIRDRLTELIGSRVGPPFSEEELEAIYQDGERRYASETPPGYADADKEGYGVYGDLVLWMQVLAKARDSGKDVVLISDDDKEDWWWRHKGLTLGPRPELVAEVRAESGVRFYMYNSVRFLELAREYLDQAVSDDALDEAEKVRTWALQEDVRPGRTYSAEEMQQMLDEGFPGPSACRIVGVTYRQLDYWARTELVSPSVAEAQGSGSQRLFSYRDLLELSLVKRLLDNGVALQRVRHGLDGLDGVSTEDLLRSTMAITHEGPRLLDSTDEVIELVQRGEGVVMVGVASVDQELKARMAALTREADDE